MRRLVLTHPFIAHIGLSLKITVSDEPNLSAQAGGDEMIFGNKFCESLNDKQLRTLICHEIFHIANSHDMRLPESVRADMNNLFDDWNRACDLAINQHLTGHDFEFPPNGQTDPEDFKKYEKQSAEQIFADLLKQREKEDENDDDQQNDDQNDQDDQNDENPDGGGNGQQDQNTEGGGQENEPDWSDWGQVIATEPTLEEKAKRMMTIQQAVNSAEASGADCFGCDEVLKEWQKPVVDWRSMLQNFIQGYNKNDYSFKNAKRVNGFYLPTLHDDSFEQICFAVDTSGSMNGEAVQMAFNEVRSAFQTFSEASENDFTVILANTRVQRVEKITETDDLNLPAYGSGGTSFSDALKTAANFDEPTGVLFYLTDGFCRVDPNDNQSFETVWVITPDGNEKFQPPFGTVVRM